MAKKKQEEVLVVEPLIKERVNKLDVSFANEDLNKLRDKLNEVIEFLS